MSDLENIMRNVPGIDDVVLQNVRGRKDADPFTSGIDLILNETVIQRQYSSDAGYVIPETTVGQTLMDSLIFTAV